MSATLTSIYPAKKSERDRWILDRRPQRNNLDPSRPYAFFVEDEYSANGDVVPVATVFLTNRECPWRCLMCDLWKNTLTEKVPPGAIPDQINFALERLPSVRQIKLYNSGSFFDPRAIPVEDHVQIAKLISRFDRVIVECHPTLIAEDTFHFNNLLNGKLEVAMGLETANPQILDKLNKQMTPQTFAAAAAALRGHDIALRVFILVKPPFMQESEALTWAKRSLDFAFDCGATVATLIPTRAGNGAMERLTDLGDFAPPQLSTLESAIQYGLTLGRGRVFADLWDAGQIPACPKCIGERIERLRWMNFHQCVPNAILCELCGGCVA